MSDVHKSEISNQPRQIEVIEPDRRFVEDGLEQRLARIEGRLREKRRREKPEKVGLELPWGMLAAALLFGTLYYGHPYYECRRMKETGQFWYGETVQTCLKKRVAERNSSVEGVVLNLAKGL